MRNNARRQSGFTLVEIMIVVAIIGLLAAIAIPNFVKARTTAQKNACIANLKQIDGAKEQWALENKKTQGDAADTTAINGYLRVFSRGLIIPERAGFSPYEAELQRVATRGPRKCRFDNFWA